MVPDWMFRAYCDVLKRGAKISYYKKNNAFEISFGKTIYHSTIRVLVIDGKIEGSVYGSVAISYLTEGKDWDEEGNLIENSNVGDIL